MRNSRSSSLLLAAALAANIAPAAAQSPSSEAPPTMEQAIAAIRAYAPKALGQQDAPGLSVAITDRTHTIAIISAGLADVATRTPVTADTRFPIGSISKSMTAIALLELHDAGKIDLNGRVKQYLPSWSLRGGERILVHQLLSHTAGVPDDYSEQSSYGYDLAALREAHTIFTPGTQWSYSNDGYAAVGAIVARVSGMPWQKDVRRHVFAPLGMDQSSAVFTTRTLARAATGYVLRDADLVATPPNPVLIPAAPMDFVNPAGSVISTPEDMARYIRFYLNGGTTPDGTRLISAASFDAMTEADHLSNGKLAGSAVTVLAEWPEFYREYGYGLAIFHTDGDHLIGHTGGVSGYTSCFQANLTRGFGAIAMSNLVEAPLHPCAIVKYAMAVLRAQSLGQPLPAPPAGPPIPAPAANVADYAGTYRSSNGSVVTIGSDDVGPYLRDGSRRYRFVVQGRDMFWTDDPRLTAFYLAFERDRAKAVDAFTNAGALYVNARYAGPRSFTYPAAWNRLTGRYETSYFGTANVMRVIVVKGKLTIDGIQPLRSLPNGEFKLGDSTIRFDSSFEGKMQRLWLDGTDLYRMDLL